MDRQILSFEAHLLSGKHFPLINIPYKTCDWYPYQMCGDTGSQNKATLISVFAVTYTLSGTRRMTSKKVFSWCLSSCPEVIKYFSYSTQMSMKFIILINVKMPTIVGILTFISMINTTSDSLKARIVFIFQDFSFYEQLKIYVQLSWAWKRFYNLGPELTQHDLLPETDFLGLRVVELVCLLKHFRSGLK